MNTRLYTMMEYLPKSLADSCFIFFRLDLTMNFRWFVRINIESIDSYDSPLFLSDQYSHGPFSSGVFAELKPLWPADTWIYFEVMKNDWRRTRNIHSRMLRAD